MTIPGFFTLVAAALVLAACVPEERLPGDPSPAQMRKDRAECEAKGGEYARAGLLGHDCFLPTNDAGKACARDSDCEGVCYGDTRQCSAVTPLYGCFSHLTDTGEIEEICID